MSNNQLEEPKNIILLKKLATIQERIIGLSKNKDGFNYKYVTGDKLLGFIKPIMIELKLLLIPDTKSIHNQVVTYEKFDKNMKSMVTKSEVLTSLSIDFIWIDSETGEELRVGFGANGMNDFDKGFGSAQTYAERYFLLKFFHIQTDKDDIETLRRSTDPEYTPITESMVNDCQSYEELSNLWNKASIDDQSQFKDLFSKRKAEIDV